MYQYNKPENDVTKCQKFTPEKRSMVNQVTINFKKVKHHQQQTNSNYKLWSIIQFKALPFPFNHNVWHKAHYTVLKLQTTTSKFK